MDPRSPLENNTGMQPGMAAGEKVTQLTPGGNAYESLQQANRAPEAPEKAPFETVVQELHKESGLPNLRTYESDLAETVKSTHVSAVSIAAQKIQSKSRSSQLEETKNPGSGVVGKIMIVLGSIVLIAAGIGAIGFVVLKFHAKSPAPIASVLSANGIIAVDQTKTVTVPAGETSFAAFIETRNTLGDASASKATVSQITLESQVGTTTTPLDVSGFLTTSGAKGLQDWFIRSLGPNYLIGFYNDQSSWQPFMIFNVLSYENAFAGMLNWENNINSDLSSFYQLSPQTISVATTVATTTPATPTTMPAAIIATTTKPKSAVSKKSATTPAPAPLPVPVIAAVPATFQDTFIDNKNVRVLSIPGQTPLLYYSFPTNDVLIITTSQAALEEVFKRLTAGQFVR